LEAAYLATTFRVEAPNENIDIRVGHMQPKLDALLLQLGATEWAYVTAWNPGSRLARSDQNTFAQDELLRLVRDRGFVLYEGLGIPDLEGWAPERSTWIAGIGRREAIELGRQFGQNAIVIGSWGGVVELVWCDE
jgi:hypothetical protein